MIADMPPKLLKLVEDYHEAAEAKVKADTDLYHTNGSQLLAYQNQQDVAKLRVFSEMWIRSAYVLGYQEATKRAAEEAAGADL